MADQGHERQPLTPAQERFARKNRAHPGDRSLIDGRMVFFYRDGSVLSRRWLVDQDGRVIQSDSFSRTSAHHGGP